MNKVSDNLHEMTGTRQQVTSANHPQSNGLVEHQNRTIKNVLVKGLGENLDQWPYILEGVLFEHEANRHLSAKYSPFYLMYNREPVLPVD